MNDDEARHVARAVAKAASILEERLDEDLPEVPMPEDLLTTLDDADLEEAAASWIKEADDEGERRRRIVEAEYERRKQ